MKGLLIKDFKLLKGQKNFFMTITAISIIMIIVSPGTSFPIGFLGFVGALFSLSSISYDEFDNGNAFLFSLPITRKDYVLEKYIFGLISGIMFLLLGKTITRSEGAASTALRISSALGFMDWPPETSSSTL